jgi:hypothetical protein
MKPMGFRELWELFAELYPGRWAVQIFPPGEQLIDQVNKYHLYVLDEEPEAFNLMRDKPKGWRMPETKAK